MLGASHGAGGLALVVIKKDGADWRTVEPMGRKLVEVADLFDIHVIETTHPDSKGVRILNRGEHGSAPLANGGNGKLLLRFGIDGSRHVRRAAERAGSRGSSLQPLINELSEMSVTYRYASAFSKAAAGPMAACIIRLLTAFALALYKPQLSARHAWSVMGIISGSTLLVSMVLSSKVNFWPVNLGSSMKFL